MINRRPTLILTIIFLCCFLFLSYVSTAEAALVQCGRNSPDAPVAEKRPCQICDLIVAAKTIVDFILFKLAPAIAILFYLWAGFVILLSGTPAKIGDGKNIFKYTTWGLIIMFSSWMIANTVLKTLAADSDVSDNWFKIECKQAGGLGIIPPPVGGLCNDERALAERYNQVYPLPNYPQGGSAALNTLIECVKLRAGGLIDQTKIFTYERDNPKCNYTRGNPVCGNCAHAVNSCHYGGNTGRQGSEGVDFNAKAGVSERALFDELKRIELTCGFGFIRFETNHTNVSTINCTGN